MLQMETQARTFSATFRPLRAVWPPQVPAGGDGLAGSPGLMLDLQERCLVRGDQHVPMTPRAFALLRHLMQRPGEAVSRAELLRSVWAGTVVEDGQVKQFVCALRATLGDDPVCPRYIQTIRSAGYRYLGGIQLLPPGRPVAETAGPTDVRLTQVLRGRRLLHVVGDGPAGTQRWLDHQTREGAPLHGAWTLHLRCAKVCQDEPCSPVYEALDALCAGAEGDVVRHGLARWAPSWARQLPWRYGAAELAEITAQGAEPLGGRSRREFARLVEALADRRPLVLRVDQLDEADPALVQLLEHLFIQVLPARLCVLVSCASPELGAALQDAATRFDGYEVLAGS